VFARLSVDPDLVRAYGAASSAHAEDMRGAAQKLTTVGAGSGSMFGPIGARFLAALTRAAEEQARTVGGLSASLMAGHRAASESARAYEAADVDARGRVTGIW
jgi:hypothetical protein